MPARKTATRRKTTPASASQPNNQQTWLNQVYNHARALRGLLNTATQNGISNAQVSSLKDVIIDIHDLCFPGMNPAIHYTQQPNARGSNMPALPAAAVTGTKPPLQQQQPAATQQRRQTAATRGGRRAARGTGGRQRFRLRAVEKQQGLTYQQAYDQRVANGERPAPLTQDQINQSSSPMRMTG